MVMMMLYLKDALKDITGDWCVRGAKFIDKVTRLKYRRHKIWNHTKSISIEQLQDIIRRFTVLLYKGIENLVEDEKTRQKLFDHIHKIPKELADSLEQA